MASKRYTLGIDIGTTGYRCIVVGLEGRCLGEETSAYSLLSPRASWAEQDPEGMPQEKSNFLRLTRQMDTYSHDRYTLPIENHHGLHGALDFEDPMLGSLGSGRRRGSPSEGTAIGEGRRGVVDVSAN